MRESKNPALKALAILQILMVALVLVTGCAHDATTPEANIDEKPAVTATAPAERPDDTSVDEALAGPRPVEQVTPTFEPTEWDAELCPNYIRIDGPAQLPYELEPGQVVYEGLDGLGRTQGVHACVTYDMRRAGADRERADISDITPSGWRDNAECDIQMPDGTTYHGYFYNRSHLLAKSLGGDDAAYNLVTGTRTQNVGANDGNGGMGYAETIARDWLDAHHDGTLQYRVTPAYVGDELVCRSTFVDIRSSDGSIDMHIEVYNAALGYEIDYATGAWRALETTPEAEVALETAEQVDYVLNTNSHKFHDPDCDSVDDMSARNRQDFTGTRDEVIAMGYEPCKRCNP